MSAQGNGAGVFPPLPWRMSGYCAATAFLTPRALVEVPLPLTVSSVLGRCLGILAYVRYEPPSPLCYNELIWAPAPVSYAPAKGPQRHGHYVARMYVDNPTTLRAGREIWGLPKTQARFLHKGQRLLVDADDGTHIELDLPSVQGRAARGRRKAATIQKAKDGSIRRFIGDFRFGVRPGLMRIVDFETNETAWRAFKSRSALPRFAALVPHFDAEMTLEQL